MKIIIMLVAVIGFGGCVRTADQAQNFEWGPYVATVAASSDETRRIKAMMEFKAALTRFPDDGINVALNGMVSSIWLNKDGGQRMAQTMLAQTVKNKWNEGVVRSLFGGLDQKNTALDESVLLSEFSEIYVWIPDEALVYPGDDVLDRMDLVLRSKTVGVELKQDVILAMFRMAKYAPVGSRVQMRINFIARSIINNQKDTFGEYSGFIRNECRVFLGEDGAIDDTMQQKVDKKPIIGRL